MSQGVLEPRMEVGVCSVLEGEQEEVGGGMTSDLWVLESTWDLALQARGDQDVSQGVACLVGWGQEK